MYGGDVPADKYDKLRNTLKLLESFLENNLYFAGNRPTLADVSIFATFMMLQNTFDNYGELPKLREWYKRCQSLPGFEENLASSSKFLAGKKISLST